MRYPLTITLLLAAVGLALAVGASPAQSEKGNPEPVEGLPPASEIVERAIERVRAEHAAKKRFFYRRNAVRKDLDGAGKVAEVSKLRFEAVQIDGDTYDRLVRKNGEPLDAEAREEEQEREQEWRKRRAERKAKRKDEPFFDRELAERFVIEVVGREQIAGRPAYVLTFTPDTSVSLPEEEDEDRFLNALRGKVWIDVEEAAIARIHARLIRKVRFGLGLVAYFKKINLRFEMRRRADGEWLPHSATTYVWGRTMLFKAIRMQESSRFSGFKRVK